MISHSSYGYGAATSWEEAVDAAIDMAMKDHPAPTVAFLYVSDHFTGEAERIRQKILKKTAVTFLTGTIGMGICCTRMEFMDEPAVVLLLLTLPDFHIQEFAFEGDLTSIPLDTGAPWSVGLIHSDPTHGISLQGPERPFSDLYMLGGLTSSRLPGLQFHTEGTMVGGTTGLILSQEVPIHTSLTQGCDPIGPRHTVTECVQNLLFKLDDRPALEVYLEEAQNSLGPDLAHAARHVFVGIDIPQRDTDDYLVRHIIGVNPDESIVAIAHEVAVGDTILFTRRDRESAEQDLDRMLHRLKDRIDQPIRAGLYFSCIARGENMFKESGFELNKISDVLGDFPLIGFFGNGEISHQNVYGYTGVLTLFC
jgi:small ligand-binding sensory domain FIST